MRRMLYETVQMCSNEISNRIHEVHGCPGRDDTKPGGERESQGALAANERGSNMHHLFAFYFLHFHFSGFIDRLKHLACLHAHTYTYRGLFG